MGYHIYLNKHIVLEDWSRSCVTSRTFFILGVCFETSCFCLTLGISVLVFGILVFVFGTQWWSCFGDFLGFEVFVRVNVFRFSFTRPFGVTVAPWKLFTINLLQCMVFNPVNHVNHTTLLITHGVEHLPRLTEDQKQQDIRTIVRQCWQLRHLVNRMLCKL